MTATVEKMNSLKAMAYYFRPDDADVAINSLNTAWTRAKLKGDLQLGDFSRSRTDLTAYEHDFAKLWFDNDKANPSVQTPVAPQIGNQMRDEITALKREKNALIIERDTRLKEQSDDYLKEIERQKGVYEKRLIDEGDKWLKDFENQGTLLRGQIASLNAQIERADKSAASGLSAQTAILDRQIASLETKLAKAENRLASAQADERTRAEAVKVAHDAELETVNVKLVDAMDSYNNQLALNDSAWQKKLNEADAKTAALVAAHEAELAPHLQSQAERKARVTILEVINYFEILGAIVGAGIMFHAVGVVLGIPAALFYYDSMNTVKKASSWESSKFAIFVCGVLSVAFAFIHYNSALTYNTSDAYPKPTVATVAAIISSGVSVAALFQNYLKKNENV